MNDQGKILVIGGGISGITTALEASEVGLSPLITSHPKTLQRLLVRSSGACY